MCDLDNGRVRNALNQEVKKFKVLCRSAQDQVPARIPIELPHLLMGHVFKDVSSNTFHMITEINITGDIADMTCEHLGLSGNMFNEYRDEDAPNYGTPHEIGTGIRLTGYYTGFIDIIYAQVEVEYREEWKHRRIVTQTIDASQQQGMTLFDFMVEHRADNLQGDDIIGIHRAREWYKVMFQSVVYELTNVIVHASTEVELYRRHFNVDIAKPKDTHSRPHAHTCPTFSTAMLFITK